MKTTNNINKRDKRYNDHTRDLSLFGLNHLTYSSFQKLPLDIYTKTILNFYTRSTQTNLQTAKAFAHDWPAKLIQKTIDFTQTQLNNLNHDFNK